jgi:hypothetical protein
MRTFCFRLLAFVLATVVLPLGTAHAQSAPAPTASEPTPPAPSAPAPDDARERAKEHFLRGVDHTDRGEWDAALVEFLRSREILPTVKNTYNAAICLRRVNRFDEALDMYETLLRDFPELPADDRQIAQRELAQLQASVGTIELRGGTAGASVLIDGRARGTLPLPGPARVGAGTHTIRVSRDGFLPFEARAEVVGMQTAVVNVQLVALTAGGRLHVGEQTGTAIDVVVDNAVVGKTPWDGVLAPGTHTVVLRGEGKVGTQPVSAAVTLNQTVTLNLLAEELDGSLRVQPKPPTASVSIDGVVVGRGAWEGRLRAGSHAVDVSADGYLAFRRDVDLKKDTPEAIEATLARDPSTFAGPSAAFGLELDLAAPIGVAFGGDVASTCTGSCSSSVPLGLQTVLHGIYEAGSGFGGGVDVGYLLAFRSSAGRSTSIAPIQRPSNPGTADDTLRLSGFTAGASAQFREGDRWPLLGRFGAGVLFGSISDTRSGSFENSKNEAYTVDLRKSASATYVYFAPELRIGRRFGQHFELNAGLTVLIMAALSQPKWKDNTQILTTDNPPTQGDGYGTFGDNTLLGSFVVFVAPGVGGRYDF